MPFTFFAHQGPFVRLSLRARRWLDPVAFTVGTMSPDFAYAAVGTPLHVWAHAMPYLVTFNVPVAIVVAWIVVRIWAPIVPDHLPTGGPFRLHDYRALSQHRFGWIATPLGALVGALSHVFLDSFTHRWGWLPHHWAWYQTPLVEERWLGRTWTPFQVAQFVGHFAFSLWCLVTIAKLGRSGWLTRSATATNPAPATTRSRLVLWGVSGTVGALALVWVLGHPYNEGTDILRVFAAFGAALTAVAVVFRIRWPQAGRPRELVRHL
ncbi:MAG: DUF4184 family protein [Ilumatobacteraceae bacterium]